MLTDDWTFDDIDLKGKIAQKYLIMFLLMYSNYDLKCMAKILEVNPILLYEVIKGKVYLSEEAVKKLFKLFLIFINH